MSAVSRLVTVSSRAVSRKRERAADASAVDDTYSFDEVNFGDLPSDTTVALIAARQRFTMLVPAMISRPAAVAGRVLGVDNASRRFEAVAGCPLVLVSELRDAVRASTLDSELRALQSAGHVVVCTSPGGCGEAVCTTADVTSFLSRARQRACNAGATSRLTALTFFQESILADWCRRSAAISAADLEAAFRVWSRGDSSGRPQRASMALVRSAPHATVAKQVAVHRATGVSVAACSAMPADTADRGNVEFDSALHDLVQHGLLVRRAAGRNSEEFAWGAPLSGRFWQFVKAARIEIVARLRQRRCVCADWGILLIPRGSLASWTAHHS